MSIPQVSLIIRLLVSWHYQRKKVKNKMAFPTSPSNDDLHTEFGRTFKYSSASNSWSAATPDAPPETAPTTLSITTSADLPLTNVIPGTKAFSTEENKLFLATGNGWFEIALLENTSPTITTGADASYALSGDGTPTVVTLSATDPEGVPITWGYQVTSGSLEDTTVTNEGGVFTVTPGTTEATFNLTFTASDGVNIDTSATTFTLSLAPQVRYAGSTVAPTAGPNFGWDITTDGAGKFFVRSGYPHKVHMYTVSGENLTYSGDLTSLPASVDLRYDNSRIMSAYGDILVIGDPNRDTAVNNGGAIHVFNHATDTFLGSIIPKGVSTQNWNLGNSVAVNSTHVFATTSQGLWKLSLADFPKLLNTDDYGSLPSFYDNIYQNNYGQTIADSITGGQSNVRINSRYVVVATPGHGSYGRVSIYDINTLNLIKHIAEDSWYPRIGRNLALNEDYLLIAWGNPIKMGVYDMREGSVGNYLRNINLWTNVSGTGASMEISGKYAIMGRGSLGCAVYNISTGTLIKNITEQSVGGGVSISGTYIIAGNGSGNGILKYN
jgi:hypothetical protein